MWRTKKQLVKENAELRQQKIELMQQIVDLQSCLFNHYGKMIAKQHEMIDRLKTDIKQVTCPCDIR